MTGAAPSERPILGVGQIMSDVLTLFFLRLPKLLLLGLPGAIGIGGVLYGTVAMEDQWSQLGFLADANVAFAAGFLAFAVALGLGLGLTAGPLTAAFDTYHRHGHVPLFPCVRTLLHRPVQAAVCGIVVTLATLAPLVLVFLATTPRVGFFATIVLIAIGMYSLGRWGMSLPAVSIDRIGVRALGRAVRLGQGYRWRIAGTCFLLWFTAVLLGGFLSGGLGLGVGAMLEFAYDVDLGNQVEEILLFSNAVLGLSVMTVLLALGLAAIRARMVEIKEPPDIGEMIGVFD
ncbi:MAG: hypothetical protein AAF409_03440 [Pseudomonadota bacterium]